MSETRAAVSARQVRWAWALFTVVAVLSAGFAALIWLTRFYPGEGLSAPAVLPAVAVVWALIGVVIVTRTGNLVGWVLLAVGLGIAAAPGLQLYALYGIAISPGAVPAPVLVAYFNASPFALVWGIGLLFLVFPTGRPPSRRWSIVAWALVIGAALHALGWIVRLDDAGRPTIPGPWTNTGFAIHNRLAVPPLNWVWQVGVGLALMGSGAAIVSLVQRYRRSNGEEREQLRWLAYVGSLIVVAFFAQITLSIAVGVDSSAGNVTFIITFCAVVMGIPSACGIAILKYHLYDIDVVVRKTVVFTVLALFITIVYVAIVVGIGSLLTDTFALQILATAVVALAFQPVRTWANRVANRFVYGKRATPYEVLARFAERIGDTYASEDVTGRIAHVIAEGTGSERAEVWLHLGDELRPTGAWPSTAANALPIHDGELPPIAGDRVAPVRHLGELLGAIAITKAPDDTLTPNESELLDRLADQSGLILANVRLTADLEAHLEQIEEQARELRSSRQRIVAAQDEERRRLERNIHDGAQQHLVALAVKLRLARSMLEGDPERGRGMLVEIASEIGAARETIHSLSLGIYPPLLEERGVAAALQSQFAGGDLPVQFDADGLARHTIEIEAAVYFCVLEALQNAAKYAGATRIDVRLRDDGDVVTFEIRDDGAGFATSAGGAGTGIRGMRDRLAVFGGWASIESAPGAGTTVRGQVPIDQAVPA
jgi:signal transduction histidine kinase